MRIFPALAPAALLAATFLAASPCMAQLVITNGDHDSARHDDRAAHQEQAARHDEHEAHAAASAGNYRAASAAHADAQHHAAVAQHQEHRANEDSHSGVRVEVGH
jgi:hypothetical protein